MKSRSGIRYAGLCGLLWLAGCSGWDSAPTQAVDGYEIAMKTKPDPLQVGQKGQIQVKLTQGGKVPVECGVALRQHMPGMEMASDTEETILQPQDPGLYGGETPVDFSMGGDWQLEVKFTCGGAAHIAVFDYHLEWPE
jgi:hypothetical protein